MEQLDDHPRRVRRVRRPHDGDAEDERDGQEHERDGARAAGEVPRDGGDHGGLRPAVPPHHGPVVAHGPVRRAGGARTGRRAAHDRPGRQDVGLDARRAGDGDGAPPAARRRLRCEGRRCGGPSAPPVRHRRTVVDDVARPPYHRVTASSASSNAVRCESATPTVQPSGGGGPDTAMSPPMLTSTPSPVADAAAAAARSTASALAVAPRSTQTPRGTTTVPDGVELDGLPSGHPLDAHGRRTVRRQALEAVVVADRPDRLADGGVDDAAGAAGRLAGRRRGRWTAAGRS